jgi:hypothetical protein
MPLSIAAVFAIRKGVVTPEAVNVALAAQIRYETRSLKGHLVCFQHSIACRRDDRSGAV